MHKIFALALLSSGSLLAQTRFGVFVGANTAWVNKGASASITHTIPLTPDLGSVTLTRTVQNGSLWLFSVVVAPQVRFENGWWFGAGVNVGRVISGNNINHTARFGNSTIRYTLSASTAWKPGFTGFVGKRLGDGKSPWAPLFVFNWARTGLVLSALTTPTGTSASATNKVNLYGFFGGIRYYWIKNFATDGLIGPVRVNSSFPGLPANINSNSTVLGAVIQASYSF